jgi:hypothetical protein
MTYLYHTLFYKMHSLLCLSPINPLFSIYMYSAYKCVCVYIYMYIYVCIYIKLYFYLFYIYEVVSLSHSQSKKQKFRDTKNKEDGKNNLSIVKLDAGRILFQEEFGWMWERFRNEIFILIDVYPHLDKQNTNPDPREFILKEQNSSFSGQTHTLYTHIFTKIPIQDVINSNSTQLFLLFPIGC